MEPSQSQVLCEPLLAAMLQLKEKPCQGVRTWNPALHPGQFIGNSRTAIGLRFACSETASDPVVARNNGTPQQPQQTPQQPKKQPWFCGTGNSWSHPFTAPTGKQWGIWSTSDLIVAAGISKFTGGKDPFSMVFTDAGLLEAYGWAKCD
jgi:hypothetical protein